MFTDFLQRIIDNPLATIAEYYASCLLENIRAVEFINDELKQDEQQAVESDFGFADRTLGKQIPARRIKEGRQVRDLLVSLGLYKANGRETLRGRVTEPITDNDGNVVGIRGYKIDAHGVGESIIVVGNEGDRKAATVSEPNELTELPTDYENQPTDDADELVVDDNQITFTRDDRVYRIRGLEKNTVDNHAKGQPDGQPRSIWSISIHWI